MLVNASYTPGDFYVDTVRGLCPSTTYEFAAWVMNVLRTSACQFNGIDPNLTFKIETTTGIVLATYNTGNLQEEAVAIWRQYGLFFETPSNASTVVVRITNNAPGGCGNDIALDDITFRPCGPLVTAGINISGDTSVNICEGDTTSFLINGVYSAGYDNPVFQWQVSTNNGTTWNDIPGAVQTTYYRTFTGPGIFQYRLSVAESGNISQTTCRVGSNLVVIYVNALPVVSMTQNTNACLGSDVLFKASGGSAYQWTGPNGFSSTSAEVTLPDVQFSAAGRYYLTAISDKGCYKNDSTLLLVNPVPVAGVLGNDHICEGSFSQLEASGGIRYAWVPAIGLSSSTIPNPVASPKDTTTYKVYVYNQYECADSAFIGINVWKKPVAKAGPDKRTKEGTPVMLDGSAAGTDVSYYWSPPAFLNHPDSLKPTANLSEDIVYTLTVTSNLGCGYSVDEVFVKVFKNVIVPNAFSPNGDGINDNWQIRGLSSYPDAILQVYNRYGQQLFESKSYNTPWNGSYKGTILPVGTYYYTIDLKIGEPPLSGWVFILR
jgi:gliding motility-associated-like protein